MANINLDKMTRVCNTCQKELPLSDFGKSVGKNNFNSNTDNLNVIYKLSCKKCVHNEMKLWREKQGKDYWKKYQGPNKQPTKAEKYGKENLVIISALNARINQAKQRSKKRKNSLAQIIDIDIDYLWELYQTQKGKCYLTGYPLEIKMNTPYTISLDRIDSSKPYIKGNVMLCCFAANRAKGDLPINEFIQLCESVLSQFNDYRKHS